MLSRVLGLARDMVFAHAIPGAPLGAFLFAFSLPNMLRDMLGEGAVNAALVPVFASTRETASKEEYRRAVASVMSLMLLIFAVVTVIGVLLFPFTPTVLAALRPITGRTLPQSDAELSELVRLMQWTFPYLFFIGAAVFAMAPLFVAKRYATPSWTPMLLNIAFILCTLMFRNRFENPAWALVVGVWLGGLAQMTVLWWDMFRHVGVVLPNFRLRHTAVPQTLWLLLPVIMGQAAGEVNKVVDRFFALSLGEDKVLALYISNRLVQLPLAIFGVAVAVSILPALSNAHTRGDSTQQRTVLVHGLRQSFFLTLPAMTALIVLRVPVIQLLFQRGAFDATATHQAAGALLYAAMGLVSFAWVKVLVQGFYAQHNTRTPVIIATCSMVLNIVLNIALVRPMGYQGLALSTSLSFTVNFLALYVVLNKQMGGLHDSGFVRGLLIMILGAGTLGVSAYGSLHLLTNWIGTATFWTLLATLTGASLAGGFAYAAVCTVFALPELRSLWRRIMP